MKVLRGTKLQLAENRIEGAITACSIATLELEELDAEAAKHFHELTKDMRVYLALWRKKHGLPGPRPRLPLR